MFSWLRSQSHLELMMLDKYRVWVLWGFLMCPKELARPNALEMLQICLHDGFIVPIYRDKVRRCWLPACVLTCVLTAGCVCLQVWSLHDEYDKLFNTYKHESSTNFKLTSSKAKKHLKCVFAVLRTPLCLVS